MKKSQFAVFVVLVILFGAGISYLVYTKLDNVEKNKIEKNEEDKNSQSNRLSIIEESKTKLNQKKNEVQTLVKKQINEAQYNEFEEEHLNKIRIIESEKNDIYSWAIIYPTSIAYNSSEIITYNVDLTNGKVLSGSDMLKKFNTINEQFNSILRANYKEYFNTEKHEDYIHELETYEDVKMRDNGLINMENAYLSINDAIYDVNNYSLFIDDNGVLKTMINNKVWYDALIPGAPRETGNDAKIIDIVESTIPKAQISSIKVNPAKSNSDIVEGAHNVIITLSELKSKDNVTGWELGATCIMACKFSYLIGGTYYEPLYSSTNLNSVTYTQLINFNDVEKMTYIARYYLEKDGIKTYGEWSNPYKVTIQ